MASLGSCCSHVAAHLFKLEVAVHFKLNESATYTRQLCSRKGSTKMSHPALPQSFTPTRDSKPIGPPQPPRPTAHSSSVSSTSGREDQDLSHKVLLHHVYPPDSVWYFAGHHCPLLLLSGAQV
ncbi:uncharacterized protein LOC143036937 isoform X2 [Oratosquilla oratoria]|uniref:uncharacterized protein LOC143036937 isoform X2 n=1 Tax=Oratosquilla oratoria TaxID=337810 RepID=UPI003F7710BB